MGLLCGSLDTILRLHYLHSCVGPLVMGVKFKFVLHKHVAM